MTPAEIRRALRDADPETRRRAVGALSESAANDAGDLVIEALGDTDWRVRKEAVRVCAELATRLRLAPQLVTAISQGENVGLRNAALEVLGTVGAVVADDLLAAIPRVSSSAKKFVVSALGDMRTPKVVPALIEALEGDDPNLSAAAVDALARVGGEEAKLALRRRLRAADAFQRMIALEALARLNAAVPWEELEPLLRDRTVRRMALSALGQSGRPEAVAPLLDALSESSLHVVAMAAVALVHLQEEVPSIRELLVAKAMDISAEKRNALRSLLHEGNMATRQAAAQLLLLVNDEVALDGIVALAAEDALPSAALAAMRTWGERAVSPLLSLSGRVTGFARATALELAADLAAAPLIAGETPNQALADKIRAALREATTDPDPAVQLAAARSFTWWADPDDAPRLVRLALSAPEEVARACADALAALAASSHDAVKSALAGVQLDGPAGAALANVVARLGGAEAFERLQTALSADYPETRKAAVEGFCTIGGRRAAELIGFALADESLDVQIAAVEALGRLKDNAGRPLGSEPLLLALSSDSPAVQAAAARALGENGEGRAVEPLRELVRSGAPGVAVAAMEGLRALRDPTLGELLVEALGHPDEEVVKQALGAIAETGGPRTAARLALGLEHPAWDVRSLAATLLGEAGGDEAREALNERLEKEGDNLVRTSISDALRTSIPVDALSTGGRD